jgi:hypothetical protein
LGETPTAEVFDGLVSLVQSLLPSHDGKLVDREALDRSLRYLAGTRLTDELLRDACWRIAGNLPLLHHRQAVPPWHVQPSQEWVPACVLSCKRELSPSGRRGAVFGLRLTGGRPCPRVVYRWWSLPQCRFYARHFRFSRPAAPTAVHPARFPYAAPEQFVSLQLYVLIDPDLCSAREPGFRLVAWPRWLDDWNREVLRARFRLDAAHKCPRGYPRTVACQRCPAAVSECRAATHTKPWQARACPVCRRDPAWFDPGLSESQCVDCQRTHAWRKS